MRFSALVMSCREREHVLERTLKSLGAGGWSDAPEVVLDDGIGGERLARIHRTWRRLIARAAEQAADYVLVCEDDVVFCRSFAHNLETWELLKQTQPGGAFFASLYNPNRPFIVRRARERYLVAHPDSVWGAQALLMTPNMARFIEAHWEEAPGNPDQRMPRLAARVTPIYFHVPSLVDHASVPTTWGGIEHSALDFDPDWRAPAQ
jgi:hypothetical protein